MKLKICSFCGKETILWKANPKACKECWAKHKPKVESEAKKESIKKRTESIKSSGAYYKRAIGQNIIDNKGKCLCDNCKAVIYPANGSNVSHIISKGSNAALYHHKLNNFILCFDCEQKFSNEGKRSEMNIFKEYEHRKELLNNEFYTNN